MRGSSRRWPQPSAARSEKQVLATLPADSRAGNVMWLLLGDVTHSSRMWGRGSFGRGPVRGPARQIIPAPRVPLVP
jgi:hypothetical protein